MDLDAMIAGAGATGRAAKVTIAVGSQLVAFSEAGTISCIDKKGAACSRDLGDRLFEYLSAYDGRLSYARSGG